MRIVIANCSVKYSGRGETQLPRSVRAIMIKEDGAVSVHSDISNKPLNYMPAKSTLTVSGRGKKQVWLFKNKKRRDKNKH